MNLKNIILSVLLAAVSITAGAQKIYVHGNDASVKDKPVSTDIESVNVDNIKFEEPTVTVVNDQGNNITSLYTLKYYINGHENDIEMMKSPLGTSTAEEEMSVDKDNKWYIDVHNGNFFSGFYSGTATIHIIATPNEGTGGTLDGYYNITVTPLPVTVSLYPTSVTVYKDFKFQLPEAKVKFGSEDITEYFNPNRTVPDAFTKDAKITDIVTCSTPGSYEITWDFKGKNDGTLDYSRHYSEIKDTVKVTVLDEAAPSGNIPVTMTWEGAASYTAPKKNDNTFEAITLPYPHINEIVKTKNPVLASNLFRYKYEIVSVTDDNGNGIEARSDKYPTLTPGTGDNNGKVWTITPKTTGTINLKVTNMDLNLAEDGSLQAPTGFEQVSETYVIYAADQTVTVTLTPDEAAIPGSWVITKQTWNLPKYTATRAGSDFTSSAVWYLGLPDGTKTSFDNDPELSGSIERTVDNVLYKFYPILRDMAEGDTIDMTEVIDDNRQFMFWAKPIDTSLGDGGFLAQKLSLTDVLQPVLTPTYNDIVANLKKDGNGGWYMQFLHTPNLKITSSTGVDISEHYNVTYHLDEGAAAAGFSIDSNTGQVSYSHVNDNLNTDTRTITYVATPKITPSIYGTGSTTITIHPAEAEYDYEVIKTKGANFGKLHFTGTGIMASGTRINAVPGLDIEFGKVGGTAWKVEETTSDYKDGQDGYPDKKVLITDGGTVEVENDGIPTDGTYYVLIPYTSGKVTIDANFAKGATYTMIGSNGYKEDYAGTDNYSTQVTWQNVLVAGVTYYLYCSTHAKTGEGIHNDGELHLHGINFTPCFISSQNDTQATTKGTVFTNGDITSNATIISSPISTVSFAIKDDGIDYTPYLRIDSKTGVITGRSSSRVLKTGRVPIVVTVMNDELLDGLVKTAEIDVLVTSIPTFAVSNRQSFDPGRELHPSVTENGVTTINTDVTLTMGGWKSQYNRSGNKTDSFSPAGTDESGDNGGVIDGYRFRSQGTQNPVDEDYRSFTHTIADGSHSSFELPVYGTYLKVEAKKTGTVRVYICQNGLVDYVGTDLETIKNSQPQMTQVKWRPMFITDETGNEIPLTDVSTNSTLKVAYNDSRVKNYVKNNPYENTGNGKAVLLDSHLNDNDIKDDYSGCTFSWYRFGNTSKSNGALNIDEKYMLDDAKLIVKAWKGMTVGQKQNIVHLQQGYGIINKSFVRYTFRVYPGKSYYMYMTGSKLGFAGFAYLPDEFLTDEKLVVPTIEMNDYEDDAKTQPSSFKDFYDAVTSKVTKAERVASSPEDYPDIYPGFNVTIKRKFATDKWTSICLPFSLSEDEFAEAFGRNALIMTYDGISAIEGSNNRFVVHMTQHTKKMVEANRPYFIRPSKTMTDDASVGVTINGVTIQSDYGKLRSANGAQSSDGTLIISDQKNAKDVVMENGHTQVGTMTKVTAPAKSFIMAGTRLYHTTKPYEVPPFRSFVVPSDKLVEPSSSSETSKTSQASKAKFTTEVYDVATRSYLDIDDTPTVIEGIKDDGVSDNGQTGKAINGVYNLQGQKVSDGSLQGLKPGIYIVNGKKMMVRNGF